MTFWSRTRRATKLRYTSTGANKGTRTLDLRFTKPLLYRLSYIGALTFVNRRILTQGRHVVNCFFAEKVRGSETPRDKGQGTQW